MGEEDKKSEEGKNPAGEEKKEDDKKSEEITEAEHPPKQTVLKVYMHCEGCATKVRRCLKGFEGVEDVITDCKSSKVVVKGEKADPLRVLERIQKKSHRQVELISPLPIPPPLMQLPNNPPQQKETILVNFEEKKLEEPQPPAVIIVVLGVYMHCEACAQEIKKRIQRMKGVESAEPDLKNSQVMVKGVFEPEKLVDYVYKRAGKQAVIVKVEPEKKEEKKAKGGGDDEVKKVEKEAKKGEESSGDKGLPPTPAIKPEAEDSKLEMKRNEFFNYYPQNHQEIHPQRYVQDMYAYPPQMFSDENPNACSVM